MKKFHNLIVNILGGILLLGWAVFPVSGDMGPSEGNLQHPVERGEARSGGKSAEIIGTLKKIILWKDEGSPAQADVSGPSFSSGSNGGLVSQDLLEKGKKLYNQGNYDKAIYEFKKVMMLDPNNKEARHYLNKLGVTGGREYSRYSTSASRLAKMSGDINEYKQRIAVLEEERAAQAQAARSLKEKEEALRVDIAIKKEENDALQRKIDSLSGQHMAKVKDLENLSEKERQEIVRLNTNLYTWKDRLAKQVALLKEKEKELKELRRRHPREKREARAPVRQEEALALEKKDKEIARLGREISVLEDRLAAQSSAAQKGDEKLRATEEWFNQKMERILDEKASSPKRYGDEARREAYYRESETGKKDLARREENFEKKVEFIKRQDRLIADLKERLVLARREINSIKKGAGKGKTEEVDALKEQLQEARARLRQKESTPGRKDNDYELLEARLKDTQERLGLVEGMMKEKEAEVRDLEEQLVEILAQFESGGE